ncbi:type II toxin-antitoxin system RelE/ParE family toxin [Pantoea coffeiphila]|uniref:Addiction module killer protein n=1 Tax=Pantoea coffeiphila TaxID=1465635 RepID=A0A2S9IAZ0_9GAMM|nr:type II toxin-antitoxin system RelE/ParE family toxin [Pantoea coffeiphila]MBM7344169.1 putative addiction module killer protein [Pantoea coffeiphila]PRD14955.1 addiction module killer protein [Pantoea coffeiphila]
MYQSKYYQDENGKQPFNDWREKLKKKDLRAVSKIDNCIDRAEAGNFGDHKFERDGVWEMRINYGSGYRVYYSIEGNKIIILLIGGTKKSQDTDLDHAIRYLQDYKKRSKNDSQY